MSARVQGESSSVQSLGCEPPAQPQVAKPAPAKVCKPTADDLEAYRARANDAQAGKVGTWLEGELRGVLDGLPDGAKTELEVSVAGNAEGATANAKVHVALERQGHEYLATADASIGGGIGTQSERGSAALTGNLEGKVVLRFPSKDEAADGVSALLQAGAMVGGGVTGVAAAMLSDSDVGPRAAHALSRTDSIEVSPKLVARLDLKLPEGPFKSSFGASATVTPLSVKLDLKQGALVLSSSASAEVKVSGSKELVPKTMSARSSLAEVKAQGEVALHASYPLSREDLVHFAAHPEELRQLVADPARKWTWSADATVSGQVLGMEFQAKRTGKPQELIDAFHKGELLHAGDVQFQGFQVQVGTTIKAGGAVGSFEFAEKARYKLVDQRGRFVPLLADAAAKSEAYSAQERLLRSRQMIGR